jgi:hypothetical protein
MATAQSDCEWSKYIPWVSTALLGVYVIYQFVKKDKCCDWVNKDVQKDQPKVATSVDIEDLGEKTAFCRCWRTKKVCIDVVVSCFWILVACLYCGYYI